jgi:hypothetical protein
MPGNASGDSSAALPGRKNRRLLSTNDNNSLCKLSRQTGILTPAVDFGGSEHQGSESLDREGQMLFGKA